MALIKRRVRLLFSVHFYSGSMRPLSIDWGENNDFRMCVTAKSLMKIPYSRPEQYLLQLHFKKVQKKFHIYLSKKDFPHA